MLGFPEGHRGWGGAGRCGVMMQALAVGGLPGRVMWGIKGEGFSATRPGAPVLIKGCSLSLHLFKKLKACYTSFKNALKVEQHRTPALC